MFTACTVLNLWKQQEKFETARFELHQLLNQPTLRGVPLLVVSTCSPTMVISAVFEKKSLLNMRSRIEGVW